MPRATIAHSTPAGATYTGSAYATINVWQQAPLDIAFTTQLNGDGTAATFATVASNQVTLSVGVYRIRGWSIMNCATAGKLFCARLQNITAGTPVWLGKPNEVSPAMLNSIANDPVVMPISGDVVLNAPATFEIQGLCNFATAVTFGSPRYSASNFTIQKELYRWLEITKTA